ncbi:Uncharacterized iron-regulated protein [Cohaesibacter sp. ES.047]|nr:Uncharacterized iron-regulated protein [Cohaesibacter sp. ES.047]
MLLTDHPMAGQLYAVGTGTRIKPDALRDALEKARYVLVGEKHDNPIHHRIQADVVRWLGEEGRTGQLVFEMIEMRYAETLSDVQRSNLSNLGDAVEWQQRGWPSWSLYQPIADAALAADMRLKPGNPDRDEMMRVAQGKAVAETALEDLSWDRDYSKDQLEGLLDELVDAHCGMMDKDSLMPLATMQRYKDAHMARAMRQDLKPDEVSVLIAGNGHVRRDRGVPMFLDDQTDTIVIGSIEVIRDKTNPQSYAAFDPALYDYVWFTARVDEIDPCVRFKEQLEQMKKGTSKLSPKQSQ